LNSIGGGRPPWLKTAVSPHFVITVSAATRDPRQVRSVMEIAAHALGLDPRVASLLAMTTKGCDNEVVQQRIGVATEGCRPW
jgi:hypothetical protein